MTARLDLLAHGASAATRAARFPWGRRAAAGGDPMRQGVKLSEFRVGQKVTAPYVKRAGHMDATAIKLAGAGPNNADLGG